MPAYTKQFARSKYYDHEILKMDGSKIGTLRIKPTNVLWKPKGATKFYSMPLESFVEWITSNDTLAARTKS